MPARTLVWYAENISGKMEFILVTEATETWLKWFP